MLSILYEQRADKSSIVTSWKSRKCNTCLPLDARLTVSLGSGVVAVVAVVIISQPADGLLSKVNMTGAGGDGSLMFRLGRIADGIEMFAWWLHAELITAGQLAIKHNLDFHDMGLKVSGYFRRARQEHPVVWT